MEQIRIVKEMREHERRIRGTDDDFRLRPRYMVWENVPGAFSSNKGQDFQAVLTEIVRIVRPDAPDVPLPARGGWRHAGSLMGYGEDGCPFSISWRLHDAQFWGVPQRRRRIALVADFGGGTAPEIQFERKGMSGDTTESGETGQRAAAETEGGVASTITATYGTKWNGNAGAFSGGNFVIDNGKFGIGNGNGAKVLCLNDQGGSIMDVSENAGTLRAESHGHEPIVYCLQGGGRTSQNSQGSTVKENISFTLNATDQHGVAYGFEPGAAKRMDAENRMNLELSPTLRADMGDNQVAVACCAGFDGSMGAKAGNIGYALEQAPTLNAGKEMHVLAFAQNQRDEVRDLNDMAGALAAEPGMKQQTFIYDARGNGDGDVVPTITVDHENRVTDYTALCMDVGFFQTYKEQAGTLLARQYKDPPIVKETYQRQTGSLLASGYSKNGTHEAANGMYITGNCVRRLTPLECERLQGYPDGWTDIGEWVDSKGKKHKESDSPRYKALGNSIAVGYANNGSGFWMWLLKRISAQYERNATLGSLFDGIGGFPLAWEHFNGKGSARWASEIEEFPIAVTKKHFPED